MSFQLFIDRWLHILAGITWIGLLYYFNFVQAQGLAAARADNTAGGITKHIAPRALAWFRWAAVVTWLSGAYFLTQFPGYSLRDAFTLHGASALIGVGAWLGTIMLFNVWVLIWPNQKKVLGIVKVDDAQKARAARVAFLASRTNVMLSIPMVFFMMAGAVGLPH
ncbi:MAG: urate hydroxylase PuuD [Acidiferrobacteraceae bacterium]